MMFTEYLKIPYDDNELTPKEQAEVETLAECLFTELENRCKLLGLTITDSCITKFSPEELESMPVIKHPYYKKDINKYDKRHNL